MSAFEGRVPGQIDEFYEKWMADRQRELDECTRALRKLPAGTRNILDDAVLLDRSLRFMTPLPPMESDIQEAKLLALTLNILEEVFATRPRPSALHQHRSESPTEGR